MVVDWFILTTVAERSIRGTFFFFGFLSFFLSFFNEPQLLLCPSFKIHEAVGHNSRHCACFSVCGLFSLSFHEVLLRCMEVAGDLWWRRPPRCGRLTGGGGGR